MESSIKRSSRKKMDWLWSISLLIPMVLVHCGEGLPSPEEGEHENRMKLGSADNARLNGSCENSDCSGKATDGNCWCDSQCSDYNDCCSDYNEFCRSESCLGSNCRGKSINGDCWCDLQCQSYGDCCADYERLCEDQCVNECTDGNVTSYTLMVLPVNECGVKRDLMHDVRSWHIFFDSKSHGLLISIG